MTLSPAARLQANSGTSTATTGFTATLPNPTMDGSSLLLFICSTSSSLLSAGADPPWFQEDTQGSLWYRWRRDVQPAGETSWAIPGAMSADWCWRIEEWSGLSFISQPDDFTKATTVTSASSGTGTATASADDFAALAMFYAAVAANGFSFPAGRSYPAGWAETDYLTRGDGSHSGDFVMAVAEAYPGAAGSVSATLTWDTTGGGDFSNVTVYGGVACYQAAAAPEHRGVLAVPG